MKVLLINPSHRDPNFPLMPDLVFSKKGVMPPLGLLYVASYILKHSSHELKVIDMQVNNFDLQKLYDFIKDYKPAMVGIASYSPTFYASYEIAKMIKEIDNKIHVNVGGPHTTIYPEETLLHECIDTLTLGEGEVSFLELLNALENGDDLSKVKGIAYKNGKNEIVFTERSPLIENLDLLPFPDRTLLPSLNNYIVLNKKSRTTTMISSRGCPYSCAYCANINKVYRQRTPENVIEEIELCKEQGYDFIQFYDATFNVNRRFMTDFCGKLIKNKLDVKWGFTGRAELLDRELIEMLKEAGCERIHIGIESAVEQTNKFLNRKSDLQKIEETFRLCKKFKIETVAYTIIGCPFESKEDIKTTINFAIKLNPDFAQFFVLVPLPGTEIYHLAILNNAFNDYFREYVKKPTDDFEIKIWEHQLSRKEIEKLVKYSYRRFYLRPRYIWSSIKKINSIKEFAIKFKAALILLSYIFKSSERQEFRANKS